MPLNFDPGAYESAFFQGRQVEEANRLRPFNAIQNLMQGTQNMVQQSRLDALQKQKEDEYARTKAEWDRTHAPGSLATLLNTQGNNSSNKLSSPVTTPLDSPDPGYEMEPEISNLPGQMPERAPLLAKFRQFQASGGQSPKIAESGIPDFSMAGYLKQNPNASISDYENVMPLFEKSAKATKEYADAQKSIREPTEKPGDLVSLQTAKLIYPKFDLQQAASLYPSGMVPRKDLEMMVNADRSDYNLGTREDQQQDKLEQEYRTLRSKALSNRSGGLGLQDAKVNAAIHSRQLIEGATDPKTGEIHINQITNPELAMSLASLTSGGNAPALETIREMTPQALQGFIKEKIGYIFGKPVDVLPQEWAQTLKHMIDRQGVVSEYLRDNYSRQMKGLKPTRLADDRASKLEAENIGASYSQMFGIDPQSILKEANIGGSQPSQNSDMVTFRDSQGGIHTIPRKNLQAAKQRDPGLVVQ